MYEWKSYWVMPVILLPRVLVYVSRMRLKMHVWLMHQTVTYRTSNASDYENTSIIKPLVKGKGVECQRENCLTRGKE